MSNDGIVVGDLMPGVLRPRRRVQDVQTETFYAFERAARAHFEGGAPQDWPLEECERLVFIALIESGRAGEQVLVTGGACGQVGGACIFHGSHFELAFPPGRRRPWCVLHEVAHVLSENVGHGPGFARHCVRLWTTLGGWDAEELLPILRCYLEVR